jgi:Fic family protein
MVFYLSKYIRNHYLNNFLKFYYIYTMLPKNAFEVTPLFPESKSDELTNLSIAVAKAAGELVASVHPVTAAAMAELVVMMNSYYSNLIEGHFTHPLDIERAVKKEYSTDDKKRMLQLESEAHIHVNKAMRQHLLDASIDVTSQQFICLLHKLFYDYLPQQLRNITTEHGEVWHVVPGHIREREVKVGKHTAPAAAALPAFIHLFNTTYKPSKIAAQTNRIIAIAASHHRLAWIHPFLDGNGRVVRLYSEAYFIREGLDAHGLWSISRGLAVYRKSYYEQLANADNPRLSDNDGRGNLSDRYLADFCVFFLKTALDQIQFMRNLFDIDTILPRIDAFCDLMVTRKKLATESRYILKALLVEGRISRSDVPRLTGKSDNTARKIVKELLELELVKIESEDFRAPLLINFPVRYAPYLFPNLYPPDIEATLIR